MIRITIPQAGFSELPVYLNGDIRQTYIHRQTVFVSYDGDAAGENGGAALIKALSQIPGLKVFRYPASSGGKDFVRAS